MALRHFVRRVASASSSSLPPFLHCSSATACHFPSPQLPTPRQIGFASCLYSPSSLADCSNELRSLVPFLSGPMELMAVPKRKVSRSRKGIRNGPKALKPHPIIVKCRSCGRVKLPHFYCCSGEKSVQE